MKKFIGFFAVCLVAMSALLLTSCGEKKLDVNKIQELVAIDEPTSSDFDDMIDELEIVLNTPAEEINNLSKEDKKTVSEFTVGMAMAAALNNLNSSDNKLSEAQVKRINDLFENTKFFDK